MPRAINVDKALIDALRANDFGQRHNSTQKKQSGFFGPISLPDGSVATEYSADVNIGNSQVSIPTITPNLSFSELERLKNSIQNQTRIPDDIFEKAVINAQYRKAINRSPFWSIPEKQQQLPKLTAIDTAYMQDSQQP